MKVALVHEFLTKLGGAERVLKIFSEMFPEAPIYTLFYDEKKTGEMFPKKKIIPSYLQKWYERVKNPALLFPFMRRAIESFRFSEYDLVLSSSSGFTHGILVPLHTTHICYCHSPMRYAWDYTHEYRKERCRGILKDVKNFTMSKMLSAVRQWDFLASDRPDYYIAASKHVQKRIKKYYKCDAHVVYPPADIDRFQVSSTHDNYFLIVSALTPWKKIELAVQAFNELRKTLIIIGDGGEKKHLETIAEPHIHFLGRAPDDVVAEYFKNCTALIFPGEDDFGITPIEAMACGKPIIAFKKGGALETIIEQQTGIFFPEPTKNSLKNAVLNFLQLQKNKIFQPDYIHEHAKKFSREQFIKHIKGFIYKAMNAKYDQT